MDKSFNFKLTAKTPLTQLCLANDLSDFISLCEFVKQLPYGRNSDRSDYTLVLIEHRGTCSTKHAFLKQIAIEHNKNEVNLCLGIYKMKDSNTKGVGGILRKYKLDYLPEAHTYLKINTKIRDVTKQEQSNNAFTTSLLTENFIQPKDIGDYKVNVHKTYLKQWIQSHNIPYTFKDIWTFREACIASL
ncbi:hypothetical protein [Lacinutrix salivirga]